MKPRPVNSRACPNPDCELQGKFGQGNINLDAHFELLRRHCNFVRPPRAQLGQVPNACCPIFIPIPILRLGA